MSVSPLRTVETCHLLHHFLSPQEAILASKQHTVISHSANRVTHFTCAPLLPSGSYLLLVNQTEPHASGCVLQAVWELPTDGPASTQAQRLVLSRGSQNPDFLCVYGNYSFMKVALLLLTSDSSPVRIGIVAPWWSASPRA